MDQNIIQEDEIPQLQHDLGSQDGTSDWADDRNDNTPDDDYETQDNLQDDNNDWGSGGDDNWV